MNFLDPRLPDRFWNKCIPEPNAGCWLWLARVDRSGEGTFSIGNFTERAHRLIFRRANGEIENGAWLKHTCGVRLCVNPAHMIATHESKKLGAKQDRTSPPRSRRRRIRPRSRSLSPKHITAQMLARGRLEIELAGPPVNEERPRTRGECVDGLRPCPWAGCKHHMYLDVTDAGSITFNFPDVEIEDMTDSCVLDLADRGGMTLEETGIAMNVSRERIRQVEVKALVKARAAGLELAA